MKNLQQNKHLLKNIIAVALVFIVTAFIFIYFNSTNKTFAATDGKIKIKLDKVTTVSLYAFGEGVDLIETTNDYDLYTAEVGTKVKLQAVNETRIFEKWIITGETATAVPQVNNLTENIITFDVLNSYSDLDITINRRNATTADYGKYMMDRYVIDGEEDLIALQNILAGNGTDDDYKHFYSDLSGYNKDTLKTNLQTGYFLISQNFTVFNEKFTGIGTSNTPFQGIMCGKNKVNSSLFITITDTEKTGENAYGLFKYLGNKALIRNLNIFTTIGIIKPTTTSNTQTKIYAGGIAGNIDNSALVNLNVSSNIGIESNYANEIYAGGIAGFMKSGSGIDAISNVVYNGEDSKWTITSHKEASTINSGFVAGAATDAYIKSVDLIVTNQIVDLKNDKTTNKYTNTKLYLGNLFGTYNTSSSNRKIDDVMIMGTSSESLRAATTNGDAVLGGLFGYVNGN